MGYPASVAGHVTLPGKTRAKNLLTTREMILARSPGTMLGLGTNLATPLSLLKGTGSPPQIPQCCWTWKLAATYFLAFGMRESLLCSWISWSLDCGSLDYRGGFSRVALTSECSEAYVRPATTTIQSVSGKLVLIYSHPG